MMKKRLVKKELKNFTQEAVVGATLGAGAPLSFVLSLSYAIYLVGPSALVGCVIILLFFPIMVRTLENL